ncbi:MAG: DUF554 domain-containing protein [Halanaerobium sp.]|nr:DUF554 domain-containing protein [Halanaerobium sp.]
MIGTLVNALAIIAGGTAGGLLKERFSPGIKDTVIKGVSLAVILIGLQMALETNSILIVIFSLVLGGIIGELVGLEKWLNRAGQFAEKMFKKGDGVARAFVQCSLIYCVGAMAVMGAIQDGLNGNPSTLYAKAMLDGFSAIAFGSTLGLGVVLSAIPVLLYQGAISLLADWAAVFLTDPIVTEMTATGGLLIVGIGLNILEITEIKVGNLLPAIFVAIILTGIFPG